MYAKHSIHAIERIIEVMPKLPEIDRYRLYATVKVLGAELDEYATANDLPHGAIRMILVDLYVATGAIAGLRDRGGRDDDYFVSEALAATHKLSMDQYFGGVAEG